MIRGIPGIFLLVIMVSHIASAQQSYAERAKQYVKQYAAYAIADQRANGVPAAITLGQGLLETEAGISELVTEANNHFGIKCKNGWDGPTFLHTDDAKNECFKKYNTAEESYNDHSAHLHRNPRYSCLFTYSLTDYAKWSHGLKKCGYATNPRYAQQLIKIIEDYKLQEYTYAAIDSNYEFSEGAEDVILVSTNTAQTDTTVVNEPLEPVTTTTVITTTTTTTKTIRSVVPAKSKPVTQPVAAAMPVSEAPVKETSKAGMVAVSGTATDAADSMALAATNATNAIKENTGTESEVSPYLNEEPLYIAGKVQQVNGLKAVWALKEDVLLPYAVNNKVRYSHLLEINDLPDAPLQFDTWIYLEKKNPSGLRDKHTVKEGETLIQIAQIEGMQLRRLAALNQLNPYEIPATGVVLNLQQPATAKPALKEYDAPKELPKDEVTGTFTAYKPKEEVNYGVSYQAANSQDTTKRDIVRQPFMKEDPPQPQMKQQPVAPVYTTGDKKYLVKRGETAFSIAKKNSITVAQLLEWNHLDPQDLKAGQTLIIKQ